MIFPLGVRRLTDGGQDHLVPWLWGVNGICGMAASVLGMCIAIGWGYTVVLLLAAAAYAGTAWVAAGPWTTVAAPVELDKLADTAV